MELIKFIHENSDWEDKLSAEPFCLTIKKKNNLAIFTYSQIDSDFYNPIVRECRGVIIDMNTLQPVCVPFYKFGNYGEEYVPEIDWTTARVQEKMDGSLIKLWYYNGEWRVSTNGMIDARDVDVSGACPYKTFYGLFKVASEDVLDYSVLDKDYTYMFELTSQFNRIVVPHDTPRITHIGTRNNKTLMETDVDIGVEKPKSYNLKSIGECVEAASKLPFSDEGYVVVDGNWNRVKVKSPAYVVAHHLKNNGVITKRRVVDMIRLGEEDEFLNYYPEFSEVFCEIGSAINAFINTMNFEIERIKPLLPHITRKEFATAAQGTICPHILFSWIDGRINNAREWLMAQTNDKVLQWVGLGDTNAV